MDKYPDKLIRGIAVRDHIDIDNNIRWIAFKSFDGNSAIPTMIFSKENAQHVKMADQEFHFDSIGDND